MKYLFNYCNTRQSLFATSIADAQKRLELKPEDKDRETVEQLAQCKLGQVAGALRSKLVPMDGKGKGGEGKKAPL